MALIGTYLIDLALVAVLASGLLYFLVWRGRDSLIGLARNAYILAVSAIVGAIALLMYLILTHDFSVAYVYSYSSTDLPLGYLISTLWGGQEGTFLLWIFFTGILGLIMMRTAGKFERGNMFFLSLFLLTVLAILVKKSPFAPMPQTPTEGAGLNPLLQNYWMVIHPPIMFSGFSGAVFPFCFAMTALVERKYLVWSEAARRWSLFAWVALGISLIMGGYWAYETLGWGGFWAWDPVENSSLIPWLFLSAQVHSLFIKRKRGGLIRFSLIAVALSFWSVLYGTFLTRSGVLADFSVHSFVDLGINQFLIGGLLLFVGIGVVLLVLRWNDIRVGPSYTTVNSRSYLVTLGVLMLFLGGGLVLLGTSAPLLTRVTDKASNVGIPYYFSTMTPIAIGVMILMALFPAFNWNEGIARKRLLYVGLGICAATMITLAVSGVTTSVIFLLLFSTGVWALSVNGWALIGTWRQGRIKPFYLSHIGLAITLLGAGASAGFDSRQQITLTMNQPAQGMGYNIVFDRVIETPKGFDCHLQFKSDNDSFEALLPHEFPRNAEGVMKKPHVENFLTHDLYVAPNSFQPASEDPAGKVTLAKNETADIGPYHVLFNDFDISGHGENAMVVSALLTISKNGVAEEVTPKLVADGGKIHGSPAGFDRDSAAVAIAGVVPEQGSVVLRFDGPGIPVEAGSPAVLVIELSRKPLIILFWLGTILMFTGGIWSMMRRRRQPRAGDQETESKLTAASPVGTV